MNNAPAARLASAVPAFATVARGTFVRVQVASKDNKRRNLLRAVQLEPQRPSQATSWIYSKVFSQVQDLVSMWNMVI
uniref:Uncharacterized protein n=1 Tax=Romanomermis culicivorax TaxID=13658 RepID=A0A915HQQ0_ROMCU